MTERAKLCTVCGQPMRPKGTPKRPNEYDHAQGCRYARRKMNWPVRSPVHAYGADGFWSRVDKSAGPDGCWPWLGTKNVKGYGCRHHKGRVHLAHGVAYELSGRSVPEGHTIDHLCRNRACQNPKHLEAVPHRVNLARGTGFVARNLAVTHCPSGHPYDAKNTHVDKDGHRSCRACGRLRNNAKYVHTSTRKSRGWLSDEEVAEVRQGLARGELQREIAARLGIGQAAVSMIKTGRTHRG